MKILALVTDAYGTSGGIGQYNRDLLDALAQSETVGEVVVLPRHGQAGSAIMPAKVRQEPARRDRTAWSTRAVALAWRWRPDVIFCGHINAAPLAGLLARVLSRPLWVQVHGIEAWDERQAAVRRAIESATLVTSVSRYTRQRLLGWCNVAPEHVRVLPNTVAADYAPRPRRADLVARYGLEGRKLVMTVGRLAAAERYKGHDRVIAALPEVAQQVPEAAYLIVGAGDDQSRLEAVAKERGVERRVLFAGAVAASELADTYALGDVFAMPSTGEGFGIVFLEAAMMGLPVVGGTRDGSLDALADGRIGRAIDPLDRPALVAALVEALQGRQPRDASAAQRFGIAHFARHVDGLVAKLAAGRARGPALASA